MPNTYRWIKNQNWIDGFWIYDVERIVGSNQANQYIGNMFSVPQHTPFRYHEQLDGTTINNGSNIWMVLFDSHDLLIQITIHLKGNVVFWYYLEVEHILHVHKWELGQQDACVNSLQPIRNSQKQQKPCTKV